MHGAEKELYLSILIAVLAVGGLVSYFFYAVIRQQKKVLSLHRENAMAQVTVLENDRARIANDLHDDLAPMLAAVRMKINSFDLIKIPDQQSLEKTNTTIDDISRRMRSISFDLMPATLQEKGLVIAVGEFVSYISSKNALQIRLIPPHRNLTLTDGDAIHLYRIVQELVHNAIRHSEASLLTLEMYLENDDLILRACDNGKGFHYKNMMKEGKGLGLKSLMNRVDLLRGEFHIDSKPGKGTIITIQIPVNK